jgi:uncharacterized membrane protein
MFEIIPKLGGRRFILTMGCAVVSTILLWFAKISGAEYVTIISLTVAAYITGNTAQKFGVKP